MKKILSLLLLILIWTPAIVAQQNIFEKAKELFQQEKYEELISLLKDYPADPSSDDSLIILLGKSHLELTNYDSSIEVFNKLVELGKDNPEYHYLLGHANMQTLMNTSNFFKKGRYANGVRTALSRCLDLQPSHVDARILLSNYYLNAPMLAVGSTKKAIEHAETLKSYAPLEGNLQLASIYNQQDEYEKAEQIYLRMIKDGTEYEKIYYLLSVISFNKEDYQMSLKYAERSIREFPEYLTAYYQYGKTSVFLEENGDQATAHLNHYLEHEKEPGQPGEHWAYLRLGQLYLQKGLVDEARKAFNSSIILKPDFEQALAELEEL